MSLFSRTLTITDLKRITETQPHLVHQTGYSGMTPLIFSSWNRNLEIAKTLLQLGADVNASNNVGATALHHACRNGRIDLVRLFVSAGANLNATDNTGMTPLMEACAKGDITTATLLINEGADLELKNGSGKSTLSFLSQDSDKRALQDIFDARTGTKSSSE